MERYKVLAKLHRLTDSFKKQFREDRKGEVIEKPVLSHTARQILGILLHQERINQRQIAIEMNISAQAVSETLKKLEMQKCIERENGAQNNENFILLTAYGEEVAVMFEKRIKNHAELVFQNLSDEELIVFDELLEKLLDINK